MELLILDKLLRPIDVVDTFISMIWTERFAEKGDFELVILSTSANRNRFVINTLLAITQSKRLMRVETIEETIDPDQGRVLKVKGPELVAMLETREAVRKNVEGDYFPVWSLSGWDPEGVMRIMFQTICINGNLSPNDIIPFIQPVDDTLYPADTIPKYTELIRWEQKPASLYSAVKDIADIYDLGFRLYRDPNASKLYFNIYSGRDRTTAQTDDNPVIFSSDMANLEDTTEFTDASKEFNVVRVMYIYKDESDNDVVDQVVVTANDTDPVPTGFDRKVKILTITAVPEDIVDVTEYLIELGKEELNKSRPFGAFDGEINQYSQYKYEIDYYLGDLVEIRGDNGASGYMRVEEQIFVQDSSGERSYPTLTTKSFINPGTWASWKYDVEWSAMGSEEYWATQ